MEDGTLRNHKQTFSHHYKNTSKQSTCNFRSSVSISLSGYTKTHLALIWCSASNVLVQRLPWHTCLGELCSVGASSQCYVWLPLCWLASSSFGGRKSSPSVIRFLICWCEREIGVVGHMLCSESGYC